MKITSTIMTFATIASISLTSNRAIGQPTTVLDAHAVSRAMLDAEPVNYIGNISFTGTNGQSVTEQFRLDFYQPDQSHGYWAVTSLAINGVNISVDPNNPPIGLPVYAGGAAFSYNANLAGIAADGTSVRYGYFYSAVFLAADVISFVNSPAGQQVVVSYQVPSGVNASDLEIDLGGNTASYQAQQGGFPVYIDPVNRPRNYTIYNTVTGQPVASGTIKYGSPDSNSSQGINAISMVDEGNVLEVVANNAANAGQYSFRELDGLSLDCSLVDTNGAVTMAKVINVSGLLPHDSFAVDVNNLPAGSTIEVSTLVNGELALLSSVTLNTNNSGQVTVLGYDRYSVTIKAPSNGPFPLGGFDSGIASYPESWDVPPSVSTGSSGKG